MPSKRTLQRQERPGEQVARDEAGQLSISHVTRALQTKKGQDFHSLRLLSKGDIN